MYWHGNFNAFALTFTLHSRDIWGELYDQKEDLHKELAVGLRLCFDDGHYFKTKDSLYYFTGKNYTNTYYYTVYIPNQQVSLSLRSNKNDSAFSDKSKWLLSQIRQHRNKDVYLINEKTNPARILMRKMSVSGAILLCAASFLHISIFIFAGSSLLLCIGTFKESIF